MGTFSNDGYVRERLDEWVTKVRNLYYLIFSTAIDLSDDSQDGQLSGAFAEALSNQDQQVELISKVCDPAQAQGTYFSTLVTLNGIKRKEATKSTVSLNVTGSDGTVIIAGSLVSGETNNEQFATDSDLTILAGVGSVTATAVNLGSISAPAGTITIIDSQISGWTTVTNPSDADLGLDEESDTELRIRRNLSVAIASEANTESVLAALVSLTTVTSAIVKENFTGSIDSDGISAHSIACIVKGGTSADIANVIWTKKSAGCDLFGSVTETVTDSQGFGQDIKFSRPTEVPIYIDIDLRKLDGFPATGEDDIKAAIIEWFENDSATRLAIGDDVIYSEIYSPCNTVTGASIVDLTSGISASPTGKIDVPIAFNALATFDTSNIIITVVV